jgi:hypothetical protein
VEEKSSPPYPKDVMTDLKEEIMNSEGTTLTVTPQSITSSKELNDPLVTLNSTQYVCNKVWRQI